MNNNLHSDARILIQGLTVPLANNTTEPSVYSAVHEMGGYGMQIVAGVSAGLGNQTIQGIEVYDLVEQAIAAQGPIDISLIFNPAYQVLDAALEAMTAGITQIIIVTHGVPPLDMIELLRRSQHTQVWILGSGSAGLIIPGQVLLGCLDTSLFTVGNVGIISRSHSLIYEVADLLNSEHLGQSLVLHLGSDPIRGSDASQWLTRFGSETQQVLLLGDIELDRDVVRVVDQMGIPVVAYNPQLKTPIVPITDAARLLRVGSAEEGPDLTVTKIRMAATLHQIPALLTVKS